MANRKNFPVRVERRRAEALQRRESDAVKHSASGDTVKAERAKTDVESLKKKISTKAI